MYIIRRVTELKIVRLLALGTTSARQVALGTNNLFFLHYMYTDCPFVMDVGFDDHISTTRPA